MRRTHTALTLGVAAVLGLAGLAQGHMSLYQPAPSAPVPPINPVFVSDCDAFFAEHLLYCDGRYPDRDADYAACLRAGSASYNLCVQAVPARNFFPQPTTLANCIVTWERDLRICEGIYDRNDPRTAARRAACIDNATHRRTRCEQIVRGLGVPGGGEGLPDPCNPTYDPGLITLSVTPADVGTGNQIDGGTGEVTSELIAVVPGSRDLVVCPNLSQALGVPDEAGAVQAALSTRVSVISEHLPEPLPIVSQLWYVNGQLSVDYQVPRAVLEAVGAEFTLAVAVLGTDRVVFAEAYDVTSQYHPSDLTSDTYLDTMDIIQAVDLFVQGQVTIETVAQVIDDVAASGTP